MKKPQYIIEVLFGGDGGFRTPVLLFIHTRSFYRYRI